MALPDWAKGLLQDPSTPAMGNNAVTANKANNLLRDPAYSLAMPQENQVGADILGQLTGIATPVGGGGGGGQAPIVPPPPVTSTTPVSGGTEEIFTPVDWNAYWNQVFAGLSGIPRFEMFDPAFGAFSDYAAGPERHQARQDAMQAYYEEQWRKAYGGLEGFAHFNPTFSGVEGYHDLSPEERTAARHYWYEQQFYGGPGSGILPGGGTVGGGGEPGGGGGGYAGYGTPGYTPPMDPSSYGSHSSGSYGSSGGSNWSSGPANPEIKAQYEQAWEEMRPIMETQVEHGMADLLEQFGNMGAQYGTGSFRGLGELANEGQMSINSLLADMKYQTELELMRQQTTLGAADIAASAQRAAAASQASIARAQMDFQQRENDLARQYGLIDMLYGGQGQAYGALGGLGSQLYGYDQNALGMGYNEWLRQEAGYTPEMMQFLGVPGSYSQPYYEAGIWDSLAPIFGSLVGGFAG